MNDKKHTQDKSAALFMPISDLMIDVYDDIERRSNNPVSISGITTGFDCLDQLIDGFHRRELIVIGGRPSIGKTALAINLAFYAATSEQSHAIALFSISISHKETALRMLCLASHVKINCIQRGNLKAKHWRKLALGSGLMAESNIQVNDNIDSLETILTACRDLKQTEQGLDLIVLDDLQGLAEQIKDTQNNQKITDIIRALKNMATELDVAVVVTSHLKHRLETRSDQRPRLSDLYHIAAIEQAADVIMFLYRDEIYHPRPDNEGLAEIIVAKQGYGKLGQAKLKFEVGFGLFTEWKQSCTFNNNQIDSELADAYQLQAVTEFEEAIKHPYSDSIDTRLHPDD